MFVDAISNSAANHSARVGTQTITDAFTLPFRLGFVTTRKAGFYSEEIAITATKRWVGIPLGTTPKAILTLFQNNTALVNAGVTSSVELTATGDGDQIAKWTNLKKFAPDGTTYVYTVKETKSSDGYEMTISEDGLTITNTFIKAELPIVLSKTLPKTGERADNAVTYAVLLMALVALVIVKKRRTQA